MDPIGTFRRKCNRAIYRNKSAKFYKGYRISSSRVHCKTPHLKDKQNVKYGIQAMQN